LGKKNSFARKSCTKRKDLKKIFFLEKKKKCIKRKNQKKNEKNFFLEKERQ